MYEQYKECHFLKVKKSIQQEDITILNVYASNNSVSKCTKQKLIGLVEEINKSIVTVGDFNTLLSVIDTSGQQISKDIKDLNNTIKQTSTDLNDIYRTLHPETCEYT